MSKLQIIHNLLINRQLWDYMARRFSYFNITSEHNVDKRQKRLLLKLMKYANKHCEFYKKLGIDVRTWQDIHKYPFLNKNDIRSNFDQFTSDNIKHMKYRISRTGGSTGEPLLFYNSNDIDGLFQNKLWKKIGYKKGDIILAMDGQKLSTDALNKNIFWYINSKNQLPYGGFGLSSLYLTDNNISYYIQYIVRLKPTFIRGYPSFIYRIAQYIIDNNISIDFEVKAIELTSESSYPKQREIICIAFKTRIVMQYGHTECCAFAYTYDNTMKYRVAPLYGYVEIIKEDGDHAKVGEMGEIIVTTLHSYAMPFIRYKTGDYAIYGGKDNHGIILNEILGRTQDYIINRNNDKVLLTALIFAQHFKALGHIKQWQIEQFTGGEIIIHIVKSFNYSNTDEAEIVSLFEKVGNVSVILDYTDNIKLTKRGKSLMLIQHIKN